MHLYNALNYLLIVFDSFCTVFCSVTIYVVDYQYRLFQKWLRTVTNCCTLLQFSVNKCFGFILVFKEPFYYNKYT